MLRARKSDDGYQIEIGKTFGKYRSVWTDKRYDANEYGTKLVNALVEGAGFTFPKSLWAVYDAIEAVTGNNKDAIILDFFAGSATTAHAVMELNANDGGNRRFIQVQIPAGIDGSLPAFKRGYTTIAEISKERIRQAGDKILEGECHPDWNRDVGFRVLKVDTSNMKDVYYTPDQTGQESLKNLVDNIKPDRTHEDLLFQVLVDWGVDLTLPISSEVIADKRVFFVDGNALIACFEKGVTEELVRKIAELTPERVVFRDNGFVSDDLKINAEQIFKQLSPETVVKAI
ncbi:MAG: hypothetical protein ISN29_00275 [Gammaproteobacteria bacterium AqS3]|nr:hypothetical protein [Gammaproteobacteria bacterium AqS3]